MKRRQNSTGGFVTLQLTFSGIRPDKAKLLVNEITTRLGLEKEPKIISGANNRDNVIAHVRYPKEGDVWGGWPDDVRKVGHAILRAIGSKCRLEESNYRRHVTKRRPAFVEEACV